MEKAVPFLGESIRVKDDDSVSQSKLERIIKIREEFHVRGKKESGVLANTLEWI